MLRKQVPDLDSLESPLISANPFGSILGVMPGSALAERIFNDPNSWQGADDDDGDLRDTEVMKWLADELGKCQANDEELSLSPVDRDVDIMLKLLPEKLNLAAPIASDKPEFWDNIAQENQLPFPPLFNHTSLDLSLNIDLRFSKIWDAKGKMFKSLQSPVSPADESKTLPSNIAQNARLAPPTALDLGATDNTFHPIVSPLPVASASTTWSILEWYGVPNTPRVNGRVPLLTHHPPTPYHTKLPVLSSLRKPSFPSANATITPALQKTAPFVPESTPIRRLPVIPDLSRTTPFQTPSRAPTPSRDNTLEYTPQRTKSPEGIAQWVKTHQRSASATTTLSGSTTKHRWTPRGQTLPAPSGSPDPFNSSPNATPIRSGNLFTRSPPAGPRPRSRSNTNPIRRRQTSGRDSPSPIVIESAPAPTRSRKPSTPPGLSMGVPA